MSTLNDLDTALEAVENENAVEETVTTNSNAFDLKVMNKLSGNKTTLYVTPENTLGQVFEKTAETLGLNKEKENTIFLNERTGETTASKWLPLGKFNVLPDTMISISQDAKVAAG